MTAKNEPDRPARFAGVLLPWLLACGMFAVYALTLDHWVAPDSLHQIAQLSGLTWTVELFGPVTYLATYPLRWLPTASIPLAANLFSAVCAALALALLARSVALLPHDHTEAERRRNRNKSGFLAARHAWLPPVLAVLAGGLQLTFWEHATAAAGEMVDVLLFAYLIRCLLEYRASGRESWLLRFAFAGGLAMADDWAIAAFFPALLLALLWFLGLPRFFDSHFVTDVFRKKVRPFNGKLSLRLLACWLAGVALLLVLPLLAHHSQGAQVNFWTGLGYVIRTDKALLTAFPLRIVLLLSVTSVIPVFFMAIRWGRLLDDASPWGQFATNGMFHVIHGFFLAACLLTMIDSPFSPRHLQPAFPCLPLYYLTALGIGYYSGYFLLVFSPLLEKFRRRPQRFLRWFNVASVGAMGLLLVLTPWLLAYKNLPPVHSQRGGMDGYREALLKTLPARGAIIMSEDSPRLFWLGAALAGSGKTTDYVLLDTSLLTHFPNYLPDLDRRHPDFKLAEGATNRFLGATNPAAMAHWIQNVAHTHELYLMHPFVGYMAELFYAHPRKLLFQLQPYPTNALAVPPMPDALLAENRAFWRQIQDEQFPALLHRLQPPGPRGGNPFEQLLELAHVKSEPDYRAQLAGNNYSLLLDSWGVELQRRGELAEAGKCFETARQLNPDNNSAQISLACNRNLQARKPLVMDSDKHQEDLLGRHRNWDQSLRQDGPPDDPNSCYRLGMQFAETRMYRQAIHQFRRAQALAPDATNAPFRLCELYIKLTDYSNAVVAADDVLRLAPDDPHTVVMKCFALVKMEKDGEALPLLDNVINLQTNNASARMLRAVVYLKLNRLSAAQSDYTQVALTSPANYGAYFGLADIAYHNKDTAAVIHNCELYLSNAPPDMPQTQQIQDWLKEFKTSAKQ